jgi:hypothetical protein
LAHNEQNHGLDIGGIDREEADLCISWAKSFGNFVLAYHADIMQKLNVSIDMIEGLPRNVAKIAKYSGNDTFNINLYKLGIFPESNFTSTQSFNALTVDGDDISLNYLKFNFQKPLISDVYIKYNPSKMSDQNFLNYLAAASKTIIANMQDSFSLNLNDGIKSDGSLGALVDKLHCRVDDSSSHNKYIVISHIGDVTDDEVLGLAKYFATPKTRDAFCLVFEHAFYATIKDLIENGETNLDKEFIFEKFELKKSEHFKGMEINVLGYVGQHPFIAMVPFSNIIRAGKNEIMFMKYSLTKRNKFTPTEVECLENFLNGIDENTDVKLEDVERILSYMYSFEHVKNEYIGWINRHIKNGDVVPYHIKNYVTIKYDAWLNYDTNV